MKELRTLLLASLLAVPLAADAAGLGKQAIHSRLNQPLDMSISLLVGSGEHLEDLRVTLASPETFDQHGIPYPLFARDLAIQVGSGDGAPMVRLTTREPVREPIVELLLNLRWPGGNLVREYAVLLDPPEANREVAPAVPSAVARPAPQPAAPVVERASNYRVGPGDTLGGIAQGLSKGAAVSTPQMAVALFRANPEAFFGDNMNNLRAGAVLTVPGREQVGRIAQAEASADMRRQYAAWRGERSAPAGEPERDRPTAIVQPAPATEPVSPAEDSSPSQPPEQVAEETQVEPEPVEETPDAPASEGAAEEARLAIVSPDNTDAALEGELAAHLDRVIATNELLRDENLHLQGQLEALERQVQTLTEQILALPQERAPRPVPVVTSAPLPAPAAAAAPWWSSPWTVVVPSLLIALIAVAGSVLFWLRERNRGVIR